MRLFLVKELVTLNPFKSVGIGIQKEHWGRLQFLLFFVLVSKKCISKILSYVMLGISSYDHFSSRSSKAVNHFLVHLI